MERGWLIMLPTYDESENIVPLCRELLALDPSFEVLVVDDDSPDGTAGLVQELSQMEPRVHLLLRTEDRGRGRAGAAGFAWGLTHGYRGVLEMDADFSHRPGHVPELIQKAEEGYGVVLGSRLVAGGEDVGRSFLRRYLTLFATSYARVLLRLRVRDVNSGFRAWTRDALLAVQAWTAEAEGPAIVQELLMRAKRQGVRMTEVPIRFTERERGSSNLTLKKLLRVYGNVTKLAFSAWEPLPFDLSGERPFATVAEQRRAIR